MSAAKTLIQHVVDGSFRTNRHAPLLETDDGLLAFADRRGGEPWDDPAAMLAFLQREFRAAVDPEERQQLLFEFAAAARAIGAAPVVPLRDGLDPEHPSERGVGPVGELDEVQDFEACDAEVDLVADVDLHRVGGVAEVGAVLVSQAVAEHAAETTP